MDTNQPTSGSPEKENKVDVRPQAPKIELKMPSIPKISLSNMPTGKAGTYIINKLREYDRVIKITKKPSLDEYKATAKATGLGITIIGIIGFIITMIVQLLGWI
ncbi:MAG: protein translocase SEC61 complex subunit gamma [Nanoarchaeota archaeon]